MTQRAPLRPTDGPTLLRSPRQDDALAILALIDPEIRQAVGWAGHSARWAATYLANGEVPDGIHVIVDVHTDEVIGALNAGLDLSTLDTVRLGGWIAPSHRGRGHMRRAVAMLADHFVSSGVSVRAEIGWEDEASHSILDRAGFTLEGEDDEDAPRDGARRRAYGRYAAPTTTAIPPPPRRTLKELSTFDAGRRVLKAMTFVVCGLLAYLLIVPVWGTTVAGEPTSCGRLLRPASGLAAQAASDCDFNLVVWRIVTLVAAVVLVFLILANRSRISRRAPRPGLMLMDDTTIARLAGPQDAAGIATTIDDVVIEGMGWPPELVPNVGTHLASTSKVGVFVVTKRTDRRPIGVISLSIDPAAEHQHRVGFWMAADHRRQGHMTRALRLVADHFVSVDSPLIAETGTDNIPTQTVLERAGFVRTGQRRARLPNDDTLVGVVYERGLTDTRVVATPRADLLPDDLT